MQEQKENKIPETRPKRHRVAAFLLVFGGLYLLLRQSGILEHITIDNVRQLVQGSGIWGILLFQGIFVFGMPFLLPAPIFVLSGLLLYGKLWGVPVMLTGITLGATSSVWFFQRFTPNVLEGTQHPILQRAASLMKKHPIRAVILVRLILGVANPANISLALSGAQARYNLIGTFLGMFPRLVVVALALEWIIELLR